MRIVWDRARPTRHAYLHFQLAGRLRGLPDPARWPLSRVLPDDDPLRPLLRYLLNVSSEPLAQAGPLALSERIWRAT